jgi:hypothetical protein
MHHDVRALHRIKRFVPSDDLGERVRDQSGIAGMENGKTLRHQRGVQVD